MLASCSPKVYTVINEKYEPLSDLTKVKVYSIDDVQNMPENAKPIGTASIHDKKFETGVNKLKEEARKAGGDAIYITEHTAYKENLHYIKSTVLKLSDNFEEIPELELEYDDSIYVKEYEIKDMKLKI